MQHTFLCVAALPLASAFAPLRVQPRTTLGSRGRASALVLSQSASSDEAESTTPPLLRWLPAVAAVGTLGATALHAPAFLNFASQWQAIRDAGVTGDELWAPFKFWLLFAVAHPLLQPALWISEVLHASPGPQIGEILPISFVVGNVVVLWLLSKSGEARGALGIALLGLFIQYVGAGLEGTNGLGDYNLAMNDGVRGCPTYEQVRQPSMATFDGNKYTGRWYEHAFHDWTQFSDVYDTTLDIELSPDKSRWLDDFGLRGPAPLAAARSWDKSPVANGAHYFLYGKFDPSYGKGPASPVLQESGFGVTFPNYIVDVQKDADGNYDEAIQFQCLERGGVRIFEGINFLSRSPTLSDERYAGMLRRAEAAGMAPYGASREQMHVVPHVQPGTPDIDNAWQRLWKGIGFGKLLALLETASHSAFEDTSLGRDVGALKQGADTVSVSSAE